MSDNSAVFGLLQLSLMCIVNMLDKRLWFFVYGFRGIVPKK